MAKIKILKITLIISLFIFAGCVEEEINEDVKVNYEITGEELIFVRDQQIYSTNKDGEEEIRLTEDNFENYAPTWLPGQKEIIYLSREEEYTKFWQLDLSTQEKKFITATKGEPNFITVSPQGDNLLYLEEGHLFLLNINQGTVQKIDTAASYPAWSPHGDSFVYLQTDKLKSVAVNKYQAGESEEVLNGSLAAPQFFNKQILIFALLTENGYNLARFNLNSLDEPEIFTQLDLPEIHQAQLQLSPDKQKLFFSYVPHLETLARKTLIMDINGEIGEELENGFDYQWHTSGSKLYFHNLKANKDNQMFRNIYQINKNGKKRELLVVNGEALVVAHQFNSNTINY